MGHSNTLGSSNIIDSASMLFGSTPIPPRRTAIRAEQLAMKRRLEQLNTALGQHDDSMQDPEFAPPREIAAKPASGRIALVVVALAAAVVWTTLFSRATQPESPARHAAPSVQNVQSALPPAIATPAVAVPETSDETAVKDLLSKWRSAWAQRDVANYLGTYSKDFQPADGSSRGTWAASRARKVAEGAPITLDIHQLAFDRIDNDHFKATFLQDYAAGTYRETARAKTLLIAREGNEWRIIEEMQR